ncbi:hypothetical protein ACHAXS_007810 [Conticribra weissflogii]
MMFSKNAITFIGTLAGVTPFIASSQSCDSLPPVIVCPYDTAPHTLDGHFREFNTTDAVMTPLHSAMGGSSAPWPQGNVLLFCSFDDEKLYLGIEFPTETFMFNATGNHHLTPKIGTIFQMGIQATLKSMGGCPNATTEEACASGGFDACSDYLVDLGGQWEIQSTEQMVEYQLGPDNGGGDEVAAHSMCRKEDVEEGGANEWSGAWSFGGLSYHYNDLTTADTSTIEGSYKFELARSLTTTSPATDVQLVPGGDTGFGIAFWDPLQSDEGWTHSGHFVSGCGEEWIDLILQDGTVHVHDDGVFHTKGDGFHDTMETSNGTDYEDHDRDHATDTATEDHDHDHDDEAVTEDHDHATDHDHDHDDEESPGTAEATDGSRAFKIRKGGKMATAAATAMALAVSASFVL